MFGIINIVSPLYQKNLVFLDNVLLHSAQQAIPMTFKEVMVTTHNWYDFLKIDMVLTLKILHSYNSTRFRYVQYILASVSASDGVRYVFDMDTTLTLKYLCFIYCSIYFSF